MIQRTGKMNPMKNRIVWPCFQVSNPAESKQISQRSPNNPPHRYQWLKAKSIKVSFVGVGREPHTRFGWDAPKLQHFAELAGSLRSTANLER
jgi:hypothetical protein